MIVYPNDNYDSYISEDNADLYFETRLNADAWINYTNKEAALITAFNSINELNLDIDPTESDQLQALQVAQCEQALYELKMDSDFNQLEGVNLGGLLNVRFETDGNSKPDRYSQRALALLEQYRSLNVITRTR
ncbi:hypothetical protein ACFL5W_01660 [Thermodesulfobacteriota bacterium]